ncbi:MAG: type IV pilus assembly protein PilB [Planctomycetota bacterium]|jgi:type IV pilus assembly protein PilB
MARQLLGQILQAQGVIDDKQIDDAVRLQNDAGLKFGQALIKMGHITDEQLARALARQSKLPYVDLSKGKISDDVISLIPANLAEEYGIIPIKVQGGDVIVALADPMQVFNLENLTFLLNMKFRCAISSETVLKEAFRKYYAVDADLSDDSAGGKKEDEDEDAPIIRLVDNMIEDAVRVRASDIHFEPFDDEIRIRFRVDGVCKTVARHPKHLHGPIISRMKILAGMDISEKRRPQDGRIKTRALSKEIDMRVSALPAIKGESIVCRILDKVEGLVSLEKLGLDSSDLERFDKIIKRPNGIFLVTGPTGSGKTTSLYAALKKLNRPDLKIITAENPIEYNLKGINQCQVKHSIGLDFSRILRAMLRQAPNIILVGEIRDEETAAIATQAALTGHLVFSTLHTNDAPSAITRLIEMGVPSYMVSTSLVAVMAQRLVRALCLNCREPYEPSAPELATVGLTVEQAQGGQVYRSKGCDKCTHSGYSGRIGIFELMTVDEDLRELTFKGASHLELRRQALLSGMTTLRTDGARKIVAGRTSIEEVLRVVSQEVGDA